MLIYWEGQKLRDFINLFKQILDLGLNLGSTLIRLISYRLLVSLILFEYMVSIVIEFPLGWKYFLNQKLEIHIFRKKLIISLIFDKYEW